VFEILCVCTGKHKKEIGKNDRACLQIKWLRDKIVKLNVLREATVFDFLRVVLRIVYWKFTWNLPNCLRQSTRENNCEVKFAFNKTNN